MSRLGIALLMVAAVGACDPAKLKHTPDAAKQIDGAPDAPAHGVATVKVYDPNNQATVVVGSPVVFIEADGTIAGTPVTDSNGVATADVHANANATAVIAVPGGTTTMMTIAGVQPGDSIILGPSKSTTSGSATFTVSYPAYTGATGYYVVGPCSYYSAGTATSYAMPVYDYCKQSMMDIVVIALNSSSQPIAYLEKANVPFVAGGSTTMSGSYLLPGTFSASYTNIDASITSLSFTREVPADTGYGTGASGTPANGTLSLNAPALNAQTSSVLTRVNRTNQINIVYQNMAGNALSYSMDAGATLLPWIGPVTPDFANNKVMVTVDKVGTSGDKPDLFFMNFGYSRPNGSAGTLSFRWYVFAPEPADVTIPALPAQFGDLLPKATDSTSGVAAISIESSMLTWDMVRLAAYDLLNGNIVTPDTSTRIRETVYQPRGG